jgi:hypothetical protein
MRKFYDTQIILTTVLKLSQIQNIIQILSIQLQARVAVIAMTVNICMPKSDSRVVGSNLSRSDWLFFE